MKFTIFYTIFTIIARARGFNLIPNNDFRGLVSVESGQSFSMVCKADSDYEYCTFEHKGNKVFYLVAINILLNIYFSF